MPNVLIGVTGSVATIKIYNLIKDFRAKFDDKVKIRLVYTDKSMYFFNPKEIQEVSYTDADEWKNYKRGDPVLHIDLRNWADLFVIAPLDANTMAKMANGICDNLLTCILRAWDPSKTIVIVPAMNTAMWNHPITKKQLEVFTEWGFVSIVPPISKLLACGDLGVGAMEETPKIADFVYSLWLSDSKNTL